MFGGVRPFGGENKKRFPVACGDNYQGQCDIPALEDGAAYTFASAGEDHSALLRSDGTAVVFGCFKTDFSSFGPAVVNGPPLPDNVFFVHPFATQPIDFIVQLVFHANEDCKSVSAHGMTGETLAFWLVRDSQTLALVNPSVALALSRLQRPIYGRLRVVLPDSSIASQQLIWKDLP